MDKEFQKVKICFLKEWWEIVGVLEDVRDVGGCYEVYIRCYDVLYRLVFFEDSIGDADLWKRIKRLKGKVVGILRTDLREMPLKDRVERRNLKIA